MEEHKHNGSGIMCGHVFNGDRPLRLIQHCPDGTWDFMCGQEDHETQEAIDQAVVVCHGCAMEDLALPHGVLHLSLSHLAEYDALQEKWNIRPLTEDEIVEFDDEA